MNSNQALKGDTDWAALVGRVQVGDAKAIEGLYAKLSPFRLLFQRSMRNGEHEDAYQELIMNLVSQIRRGSVREPDRILGFARVIAGRQAARHIRGLSHSRKQARDTVVID